MDPHDAVDVAEGIASALEYIHPKGLIHRDLKPGNVMVASGCRAVLLDFGLVKALAEISLTMTGKVIGTPRYMAPEMMLTGKVDGKSDVYQLGCILYELVTGTHAVPGKTRKEVAQRCLYEVPAAPSTIRKDLDPDLENLVMNAIEKDPAERYQSATALLEDLRGWKAGKPVPRRGSGKPARQKPGEAPRAPAGPASSRVGPRAEPQGGASVRIQAVPSPAQSGARQQGTASLAAVPGPRPGDSQLARSARSEPVSTALPPVLPGPGGRSLSTVIPVQEPARPKGAVLGMAVGALGLVGLLLVARALFLRPVAYAASEVRLSPVYGGADFSWTSEAAYPDRVQVELGDGTSRTMGDPDGSAVRSHRVEIRGLPPSSRASARILYPDGAASVPYAFETLGLPAVQPEIRYPGALSAVVAISTGDVPTRIRVEPLDPPGRPGDPGPLRTRHELPVELPGDGRGVTLRLVALPQGGPETVVAASLAVPGLLERMRAAAEYPIEARTELVRSLAGGIRTLLAEPSKVPVETKLEVFRLVEPVLDAAARERARGSDRGLDPTRILPSGFGPAPGLDPGIEFPVRFEAGMVQLVDSSTPTNSLTRHRIEGLADGLPPDPGRSPVQLAFEVIGVSPPPGAVLRVWLGTRVRLSYWFGFHERESRSDPFVLRFDPRLVQGATRLSLALSLDSVTGEALPNLLLSPIRVRLVYPER